MFDPLPRTRTGKRTHESYMSPGSDWQKAHDAATEAAGGVHPEIIDLGLPPEDREDAWKRK